MLKIRKFLKIIFIFSPVIVFFSCGETVTQAEKLLTGENKEASPYVKIDEKTKSFTLDLSTSRIEKLEKSAFFSLKSRFYQKLNAQSLDEKNTNDSKSSKSNGEKINFYFLSKIIFPDSLIEIEDYAFYVDSANLTKCEKILELDFSKANKLQKIGNFAFQGNNVKTLVLPPSIKSIGKQAFAKNQLEQVDFSQAKKLEEIQTGAFFDNKIKELDFSANSNLVEIFPGSFESNQIEKVKFNINSKPIIIRNSVFKDNVIKTEVGIENLPKNSKLENIFS